MMPALTLTTADAVARVLRDAVLGGRHVTPRGAGTKSAPASDDVLSTAGLTADFAHYAGDLVATIPAGMPLAEATARLGAAGQWLPLDPPFTDRATIGGIVATNDSGPRRYRYGAPRDLIVGIEVALTSGRVVRAGGRVVKNVAGYDLSRLFCGSHGSLGIITSATFKLAPLAPYSCTLAATFPTVASALAAAHGIAHSPLTPSAIEVQAPHAALLVRFETTANAAATMADGARAILAGSQGIVTELRGAEESEVWAAHERLVWAPLAGDESIVKVSVLPTGMDRVMAGVSAADVTWQAIGRAALGILYVRVRASGASAAAAMARIRRAAAEAGGHAQILRANGVAGVPPDTTAAAAPAAAIMYAVKQRFDPSHILPHVPDGR